LYVDSLQLKKIFHNNHKCPGCGNVPKTYDVLASGEVNITYCQSETCKYMWYCVKCSVKIPNIEEEFKVHFDSNFKCKK
jgi:hypothetical protein